MEAAIGAMIVAAVLYGGKILWDKVKGKKDNPDE